MSPLISSRLCNKDHYYTLGSEGADSTSQTESGGGSTGSDTSDKMREVMFDMLSEEFPACHEYNNSVDRGAIGRSPHILQSFLMEQQRLQQCRTGNQDLYTSQEDQRLTRLEQEQHLQRQFRLFRARERLREHDSLNEHFKQQYLSSDEVVAGAVQTLRERHLKRKEALFMRIDLVIFFLFGLLFAIIFAILLGF